MNIADKMERDSRLMGNIASWMQEHGEVLSDRQRATLTPVSEFGRSGGGDIPSALWMWTE
jgi:hypothetical protein